MELKKPGNTLTSNAQQIIADSAWNKAVAPKNMQSAVAKLEKAREAYQKAQRARQNLHNKWTEYIEQSIERWKGFATDFAERDAELDAKVTKMKEELQAARERVDATKEQLTKEDEDILEIADMEDETDKIERADIIKTGLDGMVTSLENIKVPSDTTEGQAAKRARIEHSGDGSTASPAMQPFGRPGK